MKTFKNILVSLILLLFLSTITQAQVVEPTFHRKGDYGFHEFVTKYFKAVMPASLDTFCRAGQTFVKFTVNKKGEIDSLKFSAGTPILISQPLEKAIKATSGYWKPATINDQAVDSEPFILPVPYMFKAACDISVMRNSSFENMWSMLAFEDGQDLYKNGTNSLTGRRLNCILLHPLKLHGPIIFETDKEIQKWVSTVNKEKAVNSKKN